MWPRKLDKVTVSCGGAGGRIIVRATTGESPEQVVATGDIWFSGDDLGDACDADDGEDGTTDSLERFLSTDPLDNCGPNAWPPDTDDNGTLDAGDFKAILVYWQQSCT